VSWPSLVAWVVPLLAGIGAYLAAFDVPSPGRRSIAVGYGTLFGLMLSALAASLLARDDTQHAWSAGMPWLLALAIAMATIVARRRRLATARTEVVAENPPASTAAGMRRSRWQSALLIALLASLGLRALVLAREIALRPLYPWDAWAAWAVKPKTWVLLGHYVPFGSIRDWLAQPPSELRTFSAFVYPDALAWLDVWFASAAGGWVEPLVNMPWLAVWLAILVAHFGQWRALGLGHARALLAVYALGSLPLLSVHAALAGYADLWIAAFFGLAFLAWVRWLHGRERPQLILAVVCAAMLPFIKLEGWVWCAALLLAIGFGALSPRWRLRGFVLALLATAVLFLGGLRFLFSLLGWTGADGGVLVENAGPFALLLQLSWHGDALTGVANALFALPSWNLFWWIVPLVVVWRWRELVTREWLRLPALLLLGCFSALMFLFLATAAADWAQSFTAINRLVLQLAPAVCSLLALLVRDAALPARANDATRELAASNDPA